MDLDQELLADSMKSALRVEFLATSEELSLYAGAIYSAIMWGRGINESKSQFQERKKYLK